MLFRSKKLPFNEKQYRKDLDAPKLFGETGYTTLERVWARPTFEVNGILGGFTGEGAKTVIPADLPAATAATVQRLAIAAFQSVDGSGLARVDFLMDGQSGALYLNEINTLPGFTNISMYSKMWDATGIGYAVLVDRLIELALARHRAKQQLKISAL